MKRLFIIFTLIFLVSCGKESEGGNGPGCVSRESKILQCLSIKLADSYPNTEAQIALFRQQCEFQYPPRLCY